jgi:hypothetical protein
VDDFFYICVDIKLNIMRKYTLLFLLFVLTTVAFGQKKDKIKGSKIVTTEQRKLVTSNHLPLKI